MKRNLLVALLILVSFGAFAQDIIVKKNGDEISALILEIDLEKIKFKRFDYQEGPTIFIAKSDVFMVKYANGTREVISAMKSNAVLNTENAKIISPQEAIKLSGPRVGFTVLTGKLAKDAKEDYGVSPFLTQFGWQFETRIFTTSGGLSGLAEFVPLIGGLEQGKFIPSLSALVGLRGANGFEFGIGPNVSPAGAGLALALGTNFQMEGINFPVNVAAVPSKNGVRFSVLLGFNSRKN